MSVKANYEFLFVGKDTSSFLENYYYDLFEEHGHKSGQIFVNLEIANNPIYAEELGSVIFETMIDSFFTDVDREAYDRFEHSLKAVNVAVKNFQLENEMESLGQVNAIVAVVVNQQLYISQVGDSEAYLIRKRFVSVISEGLSEESSDDLFIAVANGIIEAGDFVLFSTTRLLRYVSKTDLATCVRKTSVVETLDDVKDLIYSEILGKIGLCGMLFSKVTVEDEKFIESELNEVHKGVLQASEGKVSAREENLIGRFVSFSKGFKIPKPNGHSFRKISSEFKSNLFQKGFSKDKLFALLLILLFVLFISFVVISNSKSNDEELLKLSGILEQIEENLEMAQSRGEYDLDSALQLLDQSYDEAKMVLDSGEFRQKASTLIQEIDIARDRLQNVERIENPTVLVDFKQVDENINAQGFANLGDRLFVYDQDKVFEIVVDKLIEPFVVDEDEKLIAATGFDNRNSIVFLTESGKLIEFDDSGAVNFMDSVEGGFKKGVNLDDWGSRIYILDSTENQVWKYAYNGATRAFGKGEQYLASAAEFLKGASDLSIDGGIYAVAEDRLVYMYGGARKEFFINNAPNNLLLSPSKVYTSENLLSVIILDQSNNKVIILDKERSGNLNYRSQFVVDSNLNLKDIYADPDTNTIYLLTDTNILTLNF